MSDSLPTCAMTHSYVRHDSFILWHDSFVRMTRLIHICDMTYSYVWHDSFMSVTWLMHMFAVTNLHVRYDSLICVAWRDYGWDRRTHHMTQWHVWRDWFIRVTWQTDMLYVNRWYARRHPFICVTWLIHLCDVIHPYVWRDSFHVRFNSFVCVTWLVHTHAIIRWYVWHDSFTCVIWPLDVWHDVTWRNYLWDGRTHDMTHWYVWGDECISGTWHDLLNCVWHDAFVCVTRWDDSLLFVAWRMHICDMTRKYNWRKNRRNDLRMTTSSYAWHNEFIRLIEIPKTFISHSWMSHSWMMHHFEWFINKSFTNESFAAWNWSTWRQWEAQWSKDDDFFMCVLWIIHTCDKTHSNTWRKWEVQWFENDDLFMCMTWLIHTFDVTHWHTWRKGESQRSEDDSPVQDASSYQIFSKVSSIVIIDSRLSSEGDLWELLPEEGSFRHISVGAAPPVPENVFASPWKEMHVCTYKVHIYVRRRVTCTYTLAHVCVSVGAAPAVPIIFLKVSGIE